MRALWIAMAAAAFVAGCLSVRAIPPEKRPQTPARIESETQPALEPARIEGVQRVRVADVQDMYYVESVERWYRYWRKEWFIAFAWDGAWFPVSDNDFPPVLVQLEPTVEEREERSLTRADELRELEEQLRAIEEAEERDEGEAGLTREEELRQLEEQFRRIEAQERREEEAEELSPQ